MDCIFDTRDGTWYDMRAFAQRIAAELNMTELPGTYEVTVTCGDITDTCTLSNVQLAARLVHEHQSALEWALDVPVVVTVNGAELARFGTDQAASRPCPHGSRWQHAWVMTEARYGCTSLSAYGCRLCGARTAGAVIGR
jgi:hypothetical protein